MLHSKCLPAAAVAVTLASLAGFAAALSAPDASISRTVSAALDQRYAPRADRSAFPDPAFERSYLHLSSAPGLDTALQPVAFMAGVTIGDQVSFTASDGITRRYEVTSVAPLPMQPTRIDQRGGGPRLLLVTARQDVEGVKSAVRFIVEATANPVKLPPATPKPHSL